MNKNSGMLGLTETSNDMREIEQEAARGSERHRLAIEIYCYHVRKYIGAYMAALGRVDAIVFTGGIGENSRLVRRLVTEGMSDLGIVLDPGKNERNERDISAGPVKILAIPTNEELAIARDARRILDAAPLCEAKPAAEAAAPRSEAFRPEETAQLVLLWAQNPKGAPGALASKLASSLGRSVTAEAVRKELERLSLAAAAPAAKSPKTK